MIPSPPVLSIGLLSDTHFRERLFDLPERLAQIWSGVGLILHAGDVGDEQVLDLLAGIAPVAAVHGNDDTESAKRRLPGRLAIALSGHRILLWHSHYPDPEEERSRRVDPWGGKLERIAAHGAESGADVVVYGHTHVPMVSRHGDILLVNPGALASGSYFTRQAVPSVGRLTIAADGMLSAVHFDVRTGQAREFPQAGAEDAFGTLGDLYQEWMVEPDLLPDVEKFRDIRYRDIRSVVRAFIPAYRRRYPDGLLRRSDLIAAFRQSDGVDPSDRQAVLEVLAGGTPPPSAAP
jgi:putative phosphoesterase